MNKIKILYAFNGTGFGHASRAMSIIPLLKEFYDVDVLISGEMNKVDIKHDIRYRFNGFTFVYDNGGVNYWKTFIKINLTQFIKDIFSLPVEKYHLVISDFEPVSAYASKLRGVRSLALSHHAAFLSDKTPRPPSRDKVAEWILKNYAPCMYSLGFHFKKYDNFILWPHLRREVVNIKSKVTKEPFILVYLSAFNVGELVDILSKYKQENFILISTKGYSGAYGLNIKIEPANPDKFIELLSKCSAVITGGGFETVAEAMYLNKPVLTIPIRGQYEQACNATAAGSFDGVMVGELSENNLSRFIAMIKFFPVQDNDFKISSDGVVLRDIEQYVYKDQI